MRMAFRSGRAAGAVVRQGSAGEQKRERKQSAKADRVRDRFLGHGSWRRWMSRPRWRESSGRGSSSCTSRNIPGWRKSIRDSSKRRSRKSEASSRRTAARLRELGTEVEIKLLSGSVFDELVTAAVECKGRAMVVGAVGHGLARRLLVGSVAERTAETSPIPTLVVRPGGRLGSWLRGEHPLKILVGYDFSPASDSALRWVNELQQIGPCQTKVLHIDWPPNEADRLGYHGPMPLTENPNRDPKLPRARPGGACRAAPRARAGHGRGRTGLGTSGGSFV